MPYKSNGTWRLLDPATLPCRCQFRNASDPGGVRRKHISPSPFRKRTVPSTCSWGSAAIADASRQSIFLRDGGLARLVILLMVVCYEEQHHGAGNDAVDFGGSDCDPGASRNWPAISNDSSRAERSGLGHTSPISNLKAERSANHLQLVGVPSGCKRMQACETISGAFRRPVKRC